MISLDLLSQLSWLQSMCAFCLLFLYHPPMRLDGLLEDGDPARCILRTGTESLWRPGWVSSLL